ncbi:TetR family transcriptional regulator [Flavobacterium akiainvivens]|uniref:TetR family transcriptional regulator n=1 Tax=Flavobacterium akiainvivens TaxID=1202724 RepID=A0A0M8MGF4_9FLAO|nr:TetR/AcrR family transcriptional regulator [Flavobacterium akiainvivens]KOS05731.1 TetR family transcriptional regulator [Flavobacterium akiainvivens]SFQ37497.1 transcriptional regulator, TetR family [Flavobacterium akiainvivens]
MGSKERILRQKEQTRANILKAARQIVKQEGWQGLSMRKIADKIEYTAPIIYEYFSSKEAILQELTCKGFQLLSKDLEEAKKKHTNLDDQLGGMWMAYWDFSQKNREMYQLMYGVQMTCCAQGTPESDHPYDLIADVMSQIMKNDDEDLVMQKYFTFFSVIHGLISINMLSEGLGDDMNKQILKDAIVGITRTLHT